MIVSVANFLAAPKRGNARVARMRSEYYTPPATSLLPNVFYFGNWLVAHCQKVSKYAKSIITNM